MEKQSMEYTDCTTWEELVKTVADNYGYGVEQDNNTFYITRYGKRESERYKGYSNQQHIQDTYVFHDEIKAWGQAINLALMNLF